jgi:hypothetical protein
MLLLGAFGGSAFAGTVNFLSSPGAPVVDTVNWSLIGGDGTLFSDGQTVNSANSNLTTIGLGTSPTLGGLTSVVCPAVNPVNCSWGNQPSGYNTGDTLIWLEGLDTNENPVGTGPLTVSLANAVFGLGEYIQSTSLGQFSASLDVYDGASLLGTQTYTSDGSGDPLFIGATDTAAEITSEVITVTQCGSFECDANDFSADTVQIYGVAATPEPGTFALGGALLTLGLAVRKRFETGKQ